MQYKLLILDVDGVMTDGTKTYDLAGNCISKSFADLDFTAIKLLKQMGVNVCWLSGDHVFNKGIAESRQIDFFGSTVDGCINKLAVLPGILAHYGVTIDQTVYAGDDIFDLPIMRAIVAGGGAACKPINASPLLLDEPGVYNVPVIGGHGVVSRIFTKYWKWDGKIPCH